MRLIDLDKVRWKEGFYDMHTGEQFAPMMFNTPKWLEWATAEAEVKAIPVEWLNKRAEEIAFAYWTNARNKVTLPLNELPLLIDQIIGEWEKENGAKESVRNTGI